jgi:hypothetical protein
VKAASVAEWAPPSRYAHPEILALSDDLLARRGFALRRSEDIIRIEALGLEWDIGMMLFEPADPTCIPCGADGKQIGIFLLHGGEGDARAMAPIAEFYASRFGYRCLSMSFPGRHYFDDPSRNWPGDTVHPDGTVRTPIWRRGEPVTPDQYELVRDDKQRRRYGMRLIARAKPGTPFYDRMAAWPVAFEEGMRAALLRHFPAADYSVYLTGHSTGGPFVFMISQRVDNIAGIIAAENSVFGCIDAEKHDWSGALGKIEGYERSATNPAPRSDPFNELYIRSWRDVARYAGPEALGREGPTALMRLPSLMEEVLEQWEQEKGLPQFKAEYIVTHNIVGSLEAAARAAAARLDLDGDATRALVARYCGYARPLQGAGAKRVPDVLFAIAKDSPDHSPEVYREIVVPRLRALSPAPRVSVTRFEAGTHFYERAEPGLPLGIVPGVAQLFADALAHGFFGR